ncbi:MAG: aminotransferase class V-fold PLP-dependent enzyme [Inquilinaceae bacterium]
MTDALNVYDRLGVRRWINAGGYLTRLGGGPVSQNVRDGMAAAGDGFVDMVELQAAVSRLIAPHTGTQAAIVTCGAAAALTLATASVLARDTVAIMDRLPDTRGLKDHILVHRKHRSSYDHAIRAAGARLIDYGFNDPGLEAGFRSVEASEVEAAITDRTVGVYVAVTPHTLPELALIAGVAASHDLPVIADAAPWLPPKDNLRRFADAGATLVAFSGGKALGAPAGTGLLCGPKDLIASALVQQTDMTVVPERWNPPADLVDRTRFRGLPRQGIGRGMKVSKEEIVGLILAFEAFMATDFDIRGQKQENSLRVIQAKVDDQGLVPTRLLTVADTQRRPLLELSVDPPAVGFSADDVIRHLAALPTPVQLSERRAHRGILTVDPASLSDTDIAPLAAALTRAFADLHARSGRRA